MQLLDFNLELEFLNNTKIRLVYYGIIRVIQKVESLLRYFNNNTISITEYIANIEYREYLILSN